MKLTKVNIDDKGRITATVEITATEIYKLSDHARAVVEHGGDYTEMKAAFEMAEHLREIEKEIAQQSEYKQEKS
jgi:hypothetical protein